MYNTFNNFIFRTPYFPVSALLDFKRRINDPVFKEMLQIASPDLTASIEEGESKVLYSAYRYYQRACTRSTPFGLFAGSSIGTFGGEFTNILVSPHETYRRITRINIDFIYELTHWLERDKKIRMQLHYFPNSSIFQIGNSYRYTACFNRKTYRVHQIEYSEYIQKILAGAKDGRLISELATMLIEDDITIEEANEFILELIDEQALVSELELAATNTQPLARLINIIKSLSNIESYIINLLTEIEAQLNNISQHSIGYTINNYSHITNLINKINIKAEIKDLFQTDLFKPVQQAIVSRNILKSLQKALIFLNKITPPETHINLDHFKERFVKRYESKEMPLLFVLDNELGIGYGNISSDISPLVDDLMIPNNTLQSNAYESSIHSILLQKSLQSQKMIIELTDEDVKDIKDNWDDLPPTISVVCEILQDNAQGHLCHIKSVYGPSATAWLGRFCYLDDQIRDHALFITEKEAQMYPDVIFAEIAHIPQSRAKNAFLRPVLRPYEIPYLSKACVPRDFEIEPNDLYISVKENRIVLRSKKLNKEIVPRLSNAHNYSGQKSMSVYHFLCDMQHQSGRTGLEFNWGNAVKQLFFLPRVVYKDCILARASWIIHKIEINKFISIEDVNELLLRINEWKTKRKIPNEVLLSDGDKELYINMNNPLSIKAWLSIVKKRQSFTLVEFLFDPATAVAHDVNGHFTNEFIFAFHKEFEHNNQ